MYPKLNIFEWVVVIVALIIVLPILGILLFFEWLYSSIMSWIMFTAVIRVLKKIKSKDDKVEEAIDLTKKIRRDSFNLDDDE